jgi:hypothetical protein
MQYFKIPLLRHTVFVAGAFLVSKTFETKEPVKLLWVLRVLT